MFVYTLYIFVLFMYCINVYYKNFNSLIIFKKIICLSDEVYSLCHRESKYKDKTNIEEKTYLYV